MAVSEVVNAMRRQWLVVIIGLLATVGLTMSAYTWSKPVHEITGTILLLPPSSSIGTSIGQNENPYLQLGGLGQAVDLLSVYLSDQAAQTEMSKISPNVTFTVLPDYSTSSPLLVVDVKDSTPATAVTIRNLLMARTPVRLQEMQTELGVAASDQITSMVVTQDATAQEVGKNRLRAAVVAGFLGAVMTLVATARWDSHRLRHARPVAHRTNREPDSSWATPEDVVVTPRGGGGSKDPSEIDPLTEANSTPPRESSVSGPARRAIGERTDEPDSATA